ncbi:MAG: hypothetical protein PHR28_00365 [candidate division Zixibacteria bacterium]|nr:hypothetical protein [candidate division Zixibacteria bacterium]
MVDKRSSDSNIDKKQSSAESAAAAVHSEDEPCRLCKEIKPLCRSHIIPEFFYKPMYDDQRRLLKISTAPEERTLFKQKGITEKLLCFECEQHINEFEKVTKRLFFDNFDYLETAHPNMIRIRNLDYDKVKLFQMSLLWRAGIANDLFFENVNLGPHEERIRKMLLESNPGEPFDYGCIIVGLRTEEKIGFDVILKPERGRIGPYNCYQFILGGCLWLFVVSNQAKHFQGNDRYLQADGTWLMESVPAKEVPLVIKMVQGLRKGGKLINPYKTLRDGTTE